MPARSNWRAPERRYLSTGQLALDLRRWLEGMPVRATPDTLHYRVSKFVRRNWLGVASAAAILLALTGGIIISTWEEHKAQLAQEAALKESARAKTERDRGTGARR